MPSPSPLRGSIASLVAMGLAVCILVAGAAFLLLRAADADGDGPRTRPPPVVEIERDGLRYTFHLPTGQQALFDVTRDPNLLVNLIATRSEDAARLRAALVKEYEVESLDELREHYRSATEDLRRLGYL